MTLKRAILVPRLLWNRASQDRLSSFPEEFPDSLASLRTLLVNSAKVLLALFLIFIDIDALPLL